VLYPVLTLALLATTATVASAQNTSTDQYLKACDSGDPQACPKSLVQNR
jgi:hypothetical protein